MGIKYPSIADEHNLFPYQARRLHHYGIHSWDSQKVYDDAIASGTVRDLPSIRYDRTFLGVRETKINELTVSSSVDVDQLAAALDISYSSYARQIRDLYRAYGSMSDVLERATIRDIYECVAEPRNFLYTSVRWLPSSQRWALQGIEIAKFGDKFQLPVPIITREKTNPRDAARKVIRTIIERKAELPDFHFHADAIQADDGRIVGQWCVLLGRFLGEAVRQESSNEVELTLCQSGYWTEPSIPVVLDERGDLTTTVEDMRNYELCVVGVIDRCNRAFVVKAVAVIRIRELPWYVINALP
jgi:hypothetical protein